MPLRLTRPSVGLIPDHPLNVERETIRSVQSPCRSDDGRGSRLIAAPVPELEPRRIPIVRYLYFWLCPSAAAPAAGRICVERKFRPFAQICSLAETPQPSSRRRETMKASLAAWRWRSRAIPSVVIMRSRVAMLSLISHRDPCIGPLSVRSCARRRTIGDLEGFGIDFSIYAVERRSRSWSIPGGFLPTARYFRLSLATSLAHCMTLPPRSGFRRDRIVPETCDEKCCRRPRQTPRDTARTSRRRMARILI